MTTTIINRIPIINQVSKAYGKLDYLFHFMSLNPQFDNILDIIQPMDIITTDDFIIQEPVLQISATTANEDIIVASDNQSFADITTRYYGGLDRIVDVFIKSGLPTINTRLGGVNFNVTNSNKANVNVNYFNSNNITLATALDIRTIPEGKSFDLSFDLSFR
jgi:hypothetical protein